jgi:hypothetical protein
LVEVPVEVEVELLEEGLEAPGDGSSPKPIEAMTMATIIATANIAIRMPLLPDLGLAAGESGCSAIFSGDAGLGSSLINHRRAA